MPAEFHSRGWYLRDLGGGKHAVVCPWADEHSGQSGLTETVLFDPQGVDTLYGFKCQHAHCLGRSIRDVWDLFKSPADTWVEAEDIILPTAPAATPTPAAAVLDGKGLADATAVIAEGQRVAEVGVLYLVDGLVPAYGMLGLSVAFAKVGRPVSRSSSAPPWPTGRPFLDCTTRQTRVLIIAAEDPPEYTAWLARHLDVPPGVLTFYRQPIRLDAAGLTAIAGTVAADRYGLVLIASWQAVVRGLLRDENDNAGAVRLVEDVKAVTRSTGVPWLIDAHSGKGEDQTDEADPSKALRGASSAAGAADYTLSLRYANGPFGTRRRLSGKGASSRLPRCYWTTTPARARIPSSARPKTPRPKPPGACSATSAP